MLKIRSRFALELPEYRTDILTNNPLRKKLDASLFYADLGEMLDKTKPEVVVAYGSIYDLLSVVEACAPRGIHVMVEKPVQIMGSWNWPKGRKDI